MKYKEAAKRLTRLGCEEISRRSGGSHRKWFNPENEQATILPDWGSKDLKLGTVRAAVRQLGIEWKDFHYG